MFWIQSPRFPGRHMFQISCFLFWFWTMLNDRTAMFIDVQLKTHDRTTNFMDFLLWQNTSVQRFPTSSWEKENTIMGQRISMIFSDFHRFFNDFHRCSMDFIDFQWFSLMFIRFPKLGWFSGNFNEFEWFSVHFNGFHWLSMILSDFPIDLNYSQ